MIYLVLDAFADSNRSPPRRLSDSSFELDLSQLSSTTANHRT